MNNTDLAYIAGFFDGEGSIFISKSKKQYFLTVSITNTDIQVLEYIRKIIGGGISKSPDKRKNHAEIFRLRLYSNDAKRFLEMILPFLKVKKEQARIAIDFQSKMEMGKLTIPKEDQEKYRNIINSFNKKKKSW